MGVLARVPAAAGAADGATICGMTSAAVHRTADPPVQIQVDAGGGCWPGWALAWRGDWVYVEYSSGVGMTHMHWVSAAAVRRR